MTGHEEDIEVESGSGFDAGEESDTGAEGKEAGGPSHGWSWPLPDLQEMMEEIVDGLRDLSPTAYVRYPRIEIARTPQGYLVSLDVPGVRREDLDLSALGDELTVRGQRRRPEYETGTQVSRSERSYGKFRRVVKLPADVDPTGIRARLEAGVLQVTLPARADVEGRKIEVEAE